MFLNRLNWKSQFKNLRQDFLGLGEPASPEEMSIRKTRKSRE